MSFLIVLGCALLSAVVSAGASLFPIKTISAWALGTSVCALSALVTCGARAIHVATRLGTPDLEVDVLQSMGNAGVLLVGWTGLGAMLATLGVALVRVPLLFLGVEESIFEGPEQDREEDREHPLDR